jgi:hypothetical protein
MTNITLYEQYNNCRMIIKIGNQPSVTYNGMTYDEVTKFIVSHNELISVFTNSSKLYNFLADKIDFYNIELQLRVS